MYNLCKPFVSALTRESLKHSSHTGIFFETDCSGLKLNLQLFLMVVFSANKSLILSLIHYILSLQVNGKSIPYV
jgi:hypothetical protein